MWVLRNLRVLLCSVGYDRGDEFQLMSNDVFVYPDPSQSYTLNLDAQL